MASGLKTSSAIALVGHQLTSAQAELDRLGLIITAAKVQDALDALKLERVCYPGFTTSTANMTAANNNLNFNLFTKISELFPKA